MEAADDRARQSITTSATTTSSDRSSTSPHQYQDVPCQGYSEKSVNDFSNMATVTLLQPSSSYPTSAAYPTSYSPAGSNMIPPSDSRRNPEEGELSKRQSLPSISEVISNTKSAPYAPSTSTSVQSGTRFPSPFSGPSRGYGEVEKHGTSPPTLRPSTSFAPASREPSSSFAEPARPPFGARPSLPPVVDGRPSPPGKPDLVAHAYPHDPHKDHRPVNGVYPQTPAQPNHPASTTGSSWPTGPLPPGQLPLPSFSRSPQHGHLPPHGYPAYEQRGPPAHAEEAERRPAFEPSMYNAPWSYSESLGRLAQSSRTLFSFAEAYGRVAQEQHGAHTIPERLPTEQEVNDMLSNAEMVRAALEQVREAVQHSMRNEQAREPTKVKSNYEEEPDVSMFEEGIKSQYAIADGKKRRGRAAPPGRCHSCNRVDTPEWRRGPDGARTLCNACGLHYAKLERKRQTEQRNIRMNNNDRS